MRNIAKRLMPAHLRPKPVVDRLMERTIAAMMVRGGPFSGMRYTNSGYGVLNAKLFGTYECELWGVLSQVLQHPYERFIDVGAGEGYYAVGFAMRSAVQRVVAYDASDYARSMLTEMAAANGVSNRIEIKCSCDCLSLESELSSASCFLMMDVEGAEEILLDPIVVPSLRTTPILFEAHDILYPGIGGRIIRKFTETHSIQEIAARYRQVSDIEFLPRWFLHYVQFDLLGRLLERPDRPERMRWFYMEPSHSA